MATMAASPSGLFEPYRAMGFVCNHVPSIVDPRGSAHFLTTAVGNAYHIYNCQKLNLVSLGQVGAPISCLAVHKDTTFTAAGSDITSWRRGKPVLNFNEHAADVTVMLPFGKHLITVDSSNVLKVFDTHNGETTLSLDDLDAAHFSVTTMLHPSTYLNKILLGSTQGKLQLWNVRTRQMVFEFKGWGSRVTAMAQSPAVDVVAIGLEDGRIIVHNLKLDSTLMTFLQDGGVVTSLSFRTDGVAMLASAGTEGTIAVWNLEKKQLHSVVRDAHDSTIVSAHFMQTQPLLLTTGTDNSVKIWIFDNTGGTARVLRSRSGHHAPPTRVRHYGDDGTTLMTAAQDRTLRSFNIMNDARSHELSQGSVVKRSRQLGIKAEQLKMPPIVDFAAEPARDKDWDNIVTCHIGDSMPHTWSYENKRLGKGNLKVPKTPGEPKVVTLSACGNFSFVGFSKGHVLKFNMQSGLYRGHMGGKRTPIAHDGAMVRGIETDAVNRIVVTGARDRTLKFWDFGSGRQTGQAKLDSPVVRMCLHRESGLVAVATGDFVIHMFDVESKRKVRVFSGHSNRISDLTWSPDGRWLISSSMDGTVRTWDLPTGRLLSWFAVEDAVTSLSMSPNGDFLATTHVGSLGIFLWANRSLYGAVSLKPIDADVDVADVLALPASAQSIAGATDADAILQGDDDDDDDDDDSSEGSEESEEDEAASKDFAPLGSDLVTFSTLPASRWANLSNLTEIRQRNKPKEAPKAPKAAPFFLPINQGLQSSFALPDRADDAMDSSDLSSKVLNFGKLGVLSKFQRTLLKCAQADDFDELLDMLKAMGISAINLEIRSLSLDPEAGQLKQFLDFLIAQLKLRQNFELVQSYMHLFLKVHGDVIATSPALIDSLQEAVASQELSWVHIEGLFQHSLCVLGFLRGGGM